MKKDMAMKAIGYAVLFNFIVVLVPITVDIIDTFQSSQPEIFHYKFTGRLICYSTLECQKIWAYVIFAIELVIFSSIIYFISLHRAYSIAERKKILIWFVIAFPFAHYLMTHYVMIAALFIIGVIRFGFV